MLTCLDRFNNSMCVPGFIFSWDHGEGSGSGVAGLGSTTEGARARWAARGWLCPAWAAPRPTAVVLPCMGGED